MKKCFVISEKNDNFADNALLRITFMDYIQPIQTMQAGQDTPDLENIDSGSPGFIDYVNNLDDSSVSDMLALRVIPSFVQSMRRHMISDFTDEALKLWIVDMLLDGLKGSTVRRYVGALHTLYKQYQDSEAADSDTDGYSAVNFSVPLDKIYSDNSPKILKETEKNLIAAGSLTKVSVKPETAAYLYNKAFQYLLFNPDATLNDVVSLKYSDKMPESLHIEDIITSMRKAPQSKYVFPLQQGKRREPAIIKSLLSELHATGRRTGLTFGDTFSRDSITAIWIAAAIKEGIPYSEIVGMIKNLPPVYAFLSLIPASTVSEDRKLEIINIVADSITNKTPGWFVLRLRSGVSPDNIKDRLVEKESPLRRMISYYYPQRTVKRMVKKKMVSKQIPIIPGILFFRLPYDRVNPLISVVGDLAWCFRTSVNASSPYSVIPQSEMKAFQRCVGEYTSDIEMEIVSSLPPLAVGDEVVIEDGSMLDGQQATIRKVRSIDGTLTYTLRLSDTAFIRWQEVSLPASHLSKI